MKTSNHWRRMTLLGCTWALGGMYAHAADTLPAEPAAPPFQHYQAWRDEPLRDWREVNDRVGEVGGWRTYLRESQQDGEASGGHHGQ